LVNVLPVCQDLHFTTKEENIHGSVGVNTDEFPEGGHWAKAKTCSFCMKGATAHTSLNQIGPNLASN